MGIKVDNYDFCGYATKYNVRCGDKKIIRHGAFSGVTGKKVPLFWNHNHETPGFILGHAILEEREDGVYAYGKLNNSAAGLEAKEALIHGDVEAMSIWANNLTTKGNEVFRGTLREVSLVPAGCNPGAFIESVIVHGESIDEGEDEALIYSGEQIEIFHSEEPEPEEIQNDPDEVEKLQHSADSGRTVGEVFNSLTEEQKAAVAIVIAESLGDSEDEDISKGGNEMKHSIFDNANVEEDVQILHSEDYEKIFNNARNIGSLKQAVMNFDEDGELYHSFDKTGMTTATGTKTYGVNDVAMLLPEYKSLNTPPEFLKREMGWVSKLIGGVHHTPFSRIKSMYADITEDEARAKGYITGNQKKTEVFTTLKRTTDPQTIYKFQKLDRDDVIDITDFSIVAWIKGEMQIMLDEEIARAILIGDGRDADAEDKIQESHIRPIAKDVPLFNTIVKVKVSSTASAGEIAKQTIDEVIRARRKWKGTGRPIWWTTDDATTEMLLIEDKNGRKIYESETNLATTMRVSEIVPVEVMEGQKIEVEGVELPLIGIMVNPADYNVGRDKGGEKNFFDDFDIEYNKYRYLIETRMSGALVKPRSAVTMVLEVAEG